MFVEFFVLSIIIFFLALGVSCQGLFKSEETFNNLNKFCKAYVGIPKVGCSQLISPRSFWKSLSVCKLSLLIESFCGYTVERSIRYPRYLKGEWCCDLSSAISSPWLVKLVLTSLPNKLNWDSEGEANNMSSM